MVDVDPDTENDSDAESTTTSSSSFDQLVRSVSLVRRGQARIVRNPSARRSVVPEVYSSPYNAYLGSYNTSTSRDDFIKSRNSNAARYASSRTTSKC